MKAMSLLNSAENTESVNVNRMTMVMKTNYMGAMSILLWRIEKLVSRAPVCSLSLLRSCKRFDATDPRDKVYGLLGLISDFHVEPDYNKTVAEVYADLSHSIIQHRQRLDVLCYAGIGYPKLDDLNLPSWTPDWRHNSDFHIFPLSTFNAAEQTEAVAPSSANLLELETQGMIVDEIAALAEGHLEDDGWWSWHDFALNQGHQISNKIGIPQLQAYFRTLVADRSGYGCGRLDFKHGEEAEKFATSAVGFLYALGFRAFRACEYDSETGSLSIPGGAYTDYVLNYLKWSMSSDEEQSTQQSLIEQFIGCTQSQAGFTLHWPDFKDKNLLRRCYHTFLEISGEVCYKRTLFLTKGGYMGLAPPLTQQGDLIYVMRGCNKPVAIRKARSQRPNEGWTYSLVGECYVYGMMNGEVMQDVRVGRFNLETVKFC